MMDTVPEFEPRKQYSVLAMNTMAFTVNFTVWTMYAVIGIKIKGELGLNETEFGLLVATPILTGSLVRLPLGLLTDRFGGRIVYFIQMILVAIATYGLVFANQLWHHLVIGLCVGLAGGSFAIGIAYTSAGFQKERQGTALDIFGAGNAGAALNIFVAPLIVVAIGWRAVPEIYPVAMLIMAVIFWFLTYPDPQLERRRREGKWPTIGSMLEPLGEIRRRCGCPVPGGLHAAFHHYGYRQRIGVPCVADRFSDAPPALGRGKRPERARRGDFPRRNRSIRCAGFYRFRGCAGLVLHPGDGRRFHRDDGYASARPDRLRRILRDVLVRNLVVAPARWNGSQVRLVRHRIGGQPAGTNDN